MKNTLKLAALLALDLAATNFTAMAATPKMPTFFARRDYPGLMSNAFQVADTNGDGIPDLIASTPEGMNVQLGNGDGTFRPGPISFTSATGTVTFITADLNGDGRIDLVLTYGDNVVVSLGNGDGTFQKGAVYKITYDDGYNESYDLLVGDFNGDGILDIATAGQSGIWLLTGNAGGTFNSGVLAVSLPGCFDIAAADFNQDGKLDLVAPPTGGFAVLLGTGNGTFQPLQMFSIIASTSAGAVAAGSLTKGGPPSIAINVPLSTEVYLYFGNGTGGFSAPKLINLPGLDNLLIGDINGDGIPDLVSGSAYVAYGEGLGEFTKAVGYPVQENAGAGTHAVLSDLRNDGSIDIVTGGFEAISVLLNEGKGFLEDGIWTSVTGGAGCGAKADFNGDGRPDLAVNTPSGISILLGTGKYLTPFSAGTSIALAGAGCLVTGDINGDGIPDLLVPVEGTVVAYLGNGNGTFTLTSTTPTPSGGYLVLGDFNHDGKLDFATSGNLIALGNGNGTFRNPTDIIASPPTSKFYGIAAGDINNDRWPDLVLTTFGPPFVGAIVMLNNQQGGFTQAPGTTAESMAQPVLAI